MKLNVCTSDNGSMKSSKVLDEIEADVAVKSLVFRTTTNFQEGSREDKLFAHVTRGILLDKAKQPIYPIYNVDKLNVGLYRILEEVKGLRYMIIEAVSKNDNSHLPRYVALQKSGEHADMFALHEYKEHEQDSIMRRLDKTTDVIDAIIQELTKDERKGAIHEIPRAIVDSIQEDTQKSLCMDFLYRIASILEDKLKQPSFVGSLRQIEENIKLDPIRMNFTNRLAVKKGSDGQIIFKPSENMMEDKMIDGEGKRKVFSIYICS